MVNQMYTPSDYGKAEEKMMEKFQTQRDDAKRYFENFIKPRLDRSYKLYIAYNGDRAKEIKKWQANVSIPYAQAVVETLMPRVLDARPEFTVQGRNENDQDKSLKLQQLVNYTWEIAGADKTMEDVVRASLMFGTGFLQTSWKKDVRTHKFLQTKDLLDKKLKWEKREQVFYDAPYVEWVDNYSLWYDWHNISRESKQYWFKRLLLSTEEVKRRYPMYDKKKMEKALESGNGDLTDYAAIRNEVKYNHEKINKGSDHIMSTAGLVGQRYQDQSCQDCKMHEVFEWWRPFEDAYAVIVNEVPILKGGEMPNPYDTKEIPFVEIPYLRVPNEFEGYGIPMILENPQILLNTMKNQRIDAVTLNIHKMWIVNPLANIKKDELVTRPFGIIYSVDPNGVKEVQFSDIKSSVYKEEELLKGDMRYASGVDDFSMGVGGGAASATEVRHLRESTLERVRLFINHLGDGLGVVMRHWLGMYRQFFTEAMTIRIIGEEGIEEFPLIEQDDLKGEFDYKALVIPSIAGQNDIEKKQGMDLFQLLISLPFIDQKRLVSKILRNWNWSIESVTKEEEEVPMPEVPGMPGTLPPGAEIEGPALNPQGVPIDVAKRTLEALGTPGTKFVGEGGATSPFAEAGMPINLLTAGAPPPTPRGVPTTNTRGLSRGGKGGPGKVNTQLNIKQNATPEGSLANRVFDINK